ncbi:MAG: 3-hydroxyacyl-CoA dehydrogenase [Halofilum sp. (in: g-proteobacteria)]
MIGSGIIGRAFAVCFSRGGYEVALFDPADGVAENAVPLIRETVADLENNGLLNGRTADDVMSRIHATSSMEEAVDGAVHVQENAPEKPEIKRELFEQLDRIAPDDAVLASSSSSIVCSKFTEDLNGRHRCLIVHPTNPPYVVPILEIVPAPWTDPAVTQRTRDRLEEIGQAPITLNKEIIGFIMNRLQAPILQEAFRLVAQGVVTPEDVDRAMSEGISQRWSFIGPFEVGDLNAPNGIREYAERYEPMNRNIAETQRDLVPWTGPLIDYIEQRRRAILPIENLKQRQQWRDRRLMALAVHKKWAREHIDD